MYGSNAVAVCVFADPQDLPAVRRETSGKSGQRDSVRFKLHIKGAVRRIRGTIVGQLVRGGEVLFGNEGH